MSGLSGEALALVLSALDDAAAYRREVGDWCDGCSKQPEGQECADNDSDGATARAYDELAERLETQLRERVTVAAGSQREIEAGS